MKPMGGSVDRKVLLPPLRADVLNAQRRARTEMSKATYRRDSLKSDSGRVRRVGFALLAVFLMMSSVMSFLVVNVTSSTVSAATLSSPLACTVSGTSVIYGLEFNGGIYSMAVSGTKTTLTSTGVTLGSGGESDINGLGIATGGAGAYAVSEDPTGSGKTVHVTVYWETTSGSGSATVPALAGGYVIGGAVDPANGIYYYQETLTGSGGGYEGIFAFNTSTDTAIGEVGTITLQSPTLGNGDLTFDKQGDLYAVEGANSSGGTAPAYVVVVTRANVPTTKTTPVPVLTHKLVTNTTAPNGGVYDGLASTTTGHLWGNYSTSNSGALVPINPENGSIGKAATYSGTSSQLVDLASCAYTGELRAEKTIVGRVGSGDQFELSISGGDLPSAVTGTTSGTADGLQSQIAGPVIGMSGLSYTVSESAADGADLTNYASSYSCKDAANKTTVVASGTGTSTTFTFPSVMADSTTGPEVTCIFKNAPALTITKVASPTTYSAANQTITYTFVVTNQTKATLTKVKVTDLQSTSSEHLATGPTCKSLTSPTGTCTSKTTTTLLASQSATFTATYKVTTHDMTAGSITDTATATGTLSGKTVTSPPASATVSKVSPVTPGFTTSVKAPSSTKLGNSWNDAATVAGTSANGVPNGSVTFTFCTETSGPCTGGSTVDTLTSPTSTTATANSATYTLPSTKAQKPTAVGSYCYNASYAGGTNYNAVSSQTDNECFTVTPITPTAFTTTLKSPSTPTLGNSWNDSATVAGNATGGVPTGAVTFTFCTETSGPCTGGSTVDTLTSPTKTTATAHSASYTLPSTKAQKPTAIGSYCYNASYAGAGNYAGVSPQTDNECFTVKGVPKLVTSKIVSPASGTNVTPGEVLTYTLTFANTKGTAAAPVNYTDNLADVLDDATVTTPPALATGSGLTVSSVSGTKFTITGTVPAKTVDTVTYKVTVDAVTKDSGNHVLNNYLVPTGTTPPSTCKATNTNCTTNAVPAITIVKTATPTTVSKVGQTITYKFVATNTGGTSLTKVSVTDKFTSPTTKDSLSTPIKCIPATTTGTCTSSTTTANLGIGQHATFEVTYKVTSGDLANGVINNSATASGNSATPNNPTKTTKVTSPPSTACVKTANLVTSKIVSPASGTNVTPGEVLTYTLTFANTKGTAAAPVNYTDNLADVLDDATVTTPPALATGSGLTVSSISGTKFTITGTVPAKTVDTVTYKVTVDAVTKDSGNHVLNNYLVPTGTTPPSTCKATNTNCTTNAVPAITIVKTATPTTVTKVGQTITYKFVATNTGGTSLTKVSVTDKFTSPTTKDSLVDTHQVHPGHNHGHLHLVDNHGQPGHRSARHLRGDLQGHLWDLANGVINNSATASGNSATPNNPTKTTKVTSPPSTASWQDGRPGDLQVVSPASGTNVTPGAGAHLHPHLRQHKGDGTGPGQLHRQPGRRARRRHGDHRAGGGHRLGPHRGLDLGWQVHDHRHSAGRRHRHRDLQGEGGRGGHRHRQPRAQQLPGPHGHNTAAAPARRQTPTAPPTRCRPSRSSRPPHRPW